MSIDKLQNKIRKLKNPLMVAFSADYSQVPPAYLTDETNAIAGYSSYAKDLLVALKDTVPAVRFDFGSFSVQGVSGLNALAELLRVANAQGYYVLLDAPESWSPRQAELLADGLMEKGSAWIFDGLLLSCYMGTDFLKPYAEYLNQNEKDLFVALRTGNKSASELQDLLTGSRLVYTAAADIVKRIGEGFMARCGYSRIAGTGPASSADALNALRSKYPSVFLLVDGLDYSGANAKNCAQAFDQLGHGAVACVSGYVLAAWQETDAVDEDPISLSVQAAERLKKNLNRYVTIL